MKLEELAGVGAKDLGTRFNLVSVLPTAVVTLFVLLLLWSGAPATAPDVRRAVAVAKQLSAGELALLGVGLLGFGLLLHPLQLSITRLLEGYLGRSRPAQVVARLLRRRHLRRWDGLRQLEQTQDAAADQREAAALTLLSSYPPKRDRVMPTALGNVLRAAEDRAGGRYGINAIVAWPRLAPLLSDKLAAALADQRNQLDLACSFCVSLLLASLVTAVLLAPLGWWLSLAAVPPTLALLAYRSAVVAARAYGEGIKTAFDLHRFDLLKALHLPFPPDRQAEVTDNRRLYLFLLQGQPLNLRYAHDMAPPGTEQAPEDVGGLQATPVPTDASTWTVRLVLPPLWPPNQRRRRGRRFR